MPCALDRARRGFSIVCQGFSWHAARPQTPFPWGRHLSREAALRTGSERSSLLHCGAQCHAESPAGVKIPVLFLRPNLGPAKWVSYAKSMQRTVSMTLKSNSENEWSKKSFTEHAYSISDTEGQFEKWMERKTIHWTDTLSYWGRQCSVIDISSFFSLLSSILYFLHSFLLCFISFSSVLFLLFKNILWALFVCAWGEVT